MFIKISVKNSIGYLKIDRSNSLNAMNNQVLDEFISLHRPDEIYYVAAFHHSSQDQGTSSFKDIEQSWFSKSFF